MFQLIQSPLDPDDLTSWLEFRDAAAFSPVGGNWTRVYQSGRWTIGTDYGELSQTFNVQPALVNLDEIDPISEADPTSKAPDLVFHGGSPVWSSDEGHYWDDGTTKEINGVEVQRFLTHLRHDAPRLEHGILSFHELVERGLRNFYAHETDEHVIRFDVDAWEERSEHGGFLSNNVLTLDIQTGYLLDYLDARNAALLLAYFQSRSVHDSTLEIEIHNDGWTDLTVEGFPASKLSRFVTGLGDRYPHNELHWLAPIFPSSSDRSAEAEAETNRQIEFRTIRGESYSPDDVEHQRGFEEAGLRRPAVGAESLEEALSFYDWVFFEMEVLEKYIQSDDGNVNWWSRQGGDVAWKDIFAERVYRNDEHEVAMLLDDIEHLPFQEIPHWKVHNIAPSGEVPEEGIKNFILAEFVESKSFSDRVFEAIESLNTAFTDRYGDEAFDEIVESDPEHLVIMPPRNEQDSLLQSIDALYMVFIERIQTDNIIEALPAERQPNVEGPKSALFELTAEHTDTSNAERIFQPINGVYDLRIFADHRGAVSRWEQGMNSFELSPQTREYRDAYCVIMTKLAESLEEIQSAISR